ncbi:efflux RND transporter periplasmic adaptor subunit [Pseudoduganella violaceinigra]|uniref:efflux RND transporter periplasmic adaptor subunit n=1 Tax=Pseudoduganella violaceinigra TaxID=246602 RepID=UPI0004054727|nr:efflux RND transporter periplasmic adaptor subunit [Pseudoduganella violaceinigra]
MHYLKYLPAVVLLAACGARQEAPPAPAVPEVAVTTLALEKLPLNSDLAGRVAAVRVSEVRPQVDGVIVQRYFDEGADVRAGQLLYRIDSASYAARQAQASAELALEKASLVNLRVIAERYARLLDSRTVTQQDHDLAQANFKQGQARVQAREAALRAAQIDLQRTEVRAAIAGRIGRAEATEGALVSRAQAEPLARVQQLDPVYVDVVQSSQQMVALRRALDKGSVKPGARGVTLTLEDGSAYPHAGELQFADMQVDPQTGMVMLRARFPNPQRLLMPGMYVRARVEHGVQPDVVMLPQQAVRLGEGDKATALLVNAKGEVEPRALVLAGSHQGRWAVLSGVRAGERVIVEGGMKAAPGARVNAVEWRDPARVGAAPAASSAARVDRGG